MREQPVKFIEQNPEINLEELESRVIKILEEIRRIEKELKQEPANSFADITGNFKQFAQTYEGTSRETIKNILHQNIKDSVNKIGGLEKYLELIREYPEFLQAELASRDSAYPELNKQAKQERIALDQSNPKDIRTRSDIYIKKVWEKLKAGKEQHEGINY